MTDDFRFSEFQFFSFPREGVRAGLEWAESAGRAPNCPRVAAGEPLPENFGGPMREPWAGNRSGRRHSGPQSPGAVARAGPDHGSCPVSHFPDKENHAPYENYTNEYFECVKENGNLDRVNAQLKNNCTND
jgi:hypothetical protein